VPAQSILNGLKADVVSMDRALDIDVLHTDGKLIPANWAARSPNRSVPCTSTIVFIVRQGNPKNIRNWGDSVESSTSLVIPNPKTYSDGRYSYLAAWGHALKKSAGDEKQARESVAKLFAHVPVLDAGGPGAIRTDDVGRHHTEAFSRAYVEYLYSAAAQELAAQHFCRPKNQAILARCATRYKPVELLTVKEIAGGWEKAQQVHFADGGIFDQIHQRHQSHKS